jgi:Cupin-like domain
MLYLPAGWFHEVTSFSGTEPDQEGPRTPAALPEQGPRPATSAPFHMAVNYWLHPPDNLEPGPEGFCKPYTSGYWPAMWARKVQMSPFLQGLIKRQETVSRKGAERTQDASHAGPPPVGPQGTGLSGSSGDAASLPLLHGVPKSRVPGVPADVGTKASGPADAGGVAECHTPSPKALKSAGPRTPTPENAVNCQLAAGEETDAGAQTIHENAAKGEGLRQRSGRSCTASARQDTTASGRRDGQRSGRAGAAPGGQARGVLPPIGFAGLTRLHGRGGDVTGDVLASSGSNDGSGGFTSASAEGPDGQTGRPHAARGRGDGTAKGSRNVRVRFADEPDQESGPGLGPRAPPGQPGGLGVSAEPDQERGAVEGLPALPPRTQVGGRTGRGRKRKIPEGLPFEAAARAIPGRGYRGDSPEDSEPAVAVGGIPVPGGKGVEGLEEGGVGSEGCALKDEELEEMLGQARGGLDFLEMLLKRKAGRGSGGPSRESGSLRGAPCCGRHRSRVRSGWPAFIFLGRRQHLIPFLDGA